MANVLVEEQYLQDIADSIRLKNNSNNTYTPALMASAIENILGGLGGMSFTIVTLTLYRTNTWIGTANVGSSAGYSTSSNSWYLAKGLIQKDKKYIITTRNAATQCYDYIVVDNNEKVMKASDKRSDTGGINMMFLLDTSNLDDSNGLNIVVAYGKQDGTYSLNNNFLTYVPSVSGEHNISVSEIVLL